MIIFNPEQSDMNTSGKVYIYIYKLYMYCIIHYTVIVRVILYIKSIHLTRRLSVWQLCEHVYIIVVLSEYLIAFCSKWRKVASGFFKHY